MKRNKIVETLLKEGFSEKTLVKFSDKQLSELHTRIVGEADIMISNKDPEKAKKVVDAKGLNKSIEFYEEKPSSVLSKKQSKKMDTDKDGDIDGKDLKNLRKKKETTVETNETKKWLNSIAETNFHSFTSKNEIMELINIKLNEVEVGPNVKKGHNDIPEFMTYDAITKSEVKEDDVKTKPKVKPGTKPSKPKTPYQPGPGKNPKPKALKEKEDANK